MAKTTLDCSLLSNRKLSPLYHFLEFQAPRAFPEVMPGQFAEILVPHAPHTFLRRPFSVYDADQDKNILRFIIKIAGAGTGILCSLKAGEVVNILFPLGQGFTKTEGKALIVGGGVGIAPMYLLAKWLHKQEIPVQILLGGRSESDIINTAEFSAFGDLGMTTEDGSVGVKGLITAHPWLEHIAPDITRIYTCGPDPMMRAIASIAEKQQVDCEVSLENTMACGYGVCLSCIVSTDEGNLCTCTEGPVFNIKRLKDWIPQTGKQLKPE